mgnify:CR=1 FL=1
MNGMTFVNTPGYYYSIAYFLAAFLVNRTNKQRDGVKGWKRWLIHIGFFGGIVWFMELTDGVRQMLFIPCMLVSISMLLFYIYLYCDFGLKEAGYLLCQSIYLWRVCRVFVLADSFFIFSRSGTEVWTGLDGNGLNYCWSMPVSSVCCIFWNASERGDGGISINSRELITVIIIAAAVFAVSISVIWIRVHCSAVVSPGRCLRSGRWWT